MTILDQLAQHAKMRTELAKQRVSAEEIRRQARNLPKGTFEFEKSLRKEGLSFICECKKASPSKGLISPRFSLSRHRSGIRGGRCGLYFRPDRAGMVSGQ